VGLNVGVATVPPPPPLELLIVQLKMFWLEVYPPVAPVKPAYAVFEPMVFGILIGQVMENAPAVTVSVMVIARFVPS
jgi:hypothetical protein